MLPGTLSSEKHEDRSYWELWGPIFSTDGDDSPGSTGTFSPIVLVIRVEHHLSPIHD